MSHSLTINDMDPDYAIFYLVEALRGGGQGVNNGLCTTTNVMQRSTT